MFTMFQMPAAVDMPVVERPAAPARRREERGGMDM